MARRMVAADGRLVSFAAEFPVLVSTEQEPGEVSTWRHKAGDPPGPESWASLRVVPAQRTDHRVAVPTPDPGWVTHVRLHTQAAGGRLLVDELAVVRLDPAGRKRYLTDCSEDLPQVRAEAGGTWVRALVGSGLTTTLAQLLLGLAPPIWAGGDSFPSFPGGRSLLSAVSGVSDVVHEVLVVDRRSPGATTRVRLPSGTDLWYVVLVWDSDGRWDVAWTDRAPLVRQPGTALPTPQRVRTLERRVDLHVSRLVCLDDSDDFFGGDGEATFTLTVRPSDGFPDQVRTIDWKPMESHSELAVDETFSLTGAAAAAPMLSVSAVEHDDRFPDDDDAASTGAYTVPFAQGPGMEAFTQQVTFDSGRGGDGLRFLAHCSADVRYV